MFQDLPNLKFMCLMDIENDSQYFQVAISDLSRSEFQVAISKFQVPNQDPGQGFKIKFPSFKFQAKIQV